MKIGDLFDENRFSPFPFSIPVFLYFPLGCSLAILRIFIGFQAFILSSLLSKFPVVRCFFLRIMCCVLGFVIVTDGYRNYNDSVKIIIANHVTNFDHLALNLLFHVSVPSVWNLPSYLNWILGYTDFGVTEGKQILLKNVKSFIKSSNIPVLIFPEGATTNGKRGLLKFSSWPFLLNDDIQPIALRVRRPKFLNISLSVLGSRWWSDMLWFLFVPYTVFELKLLPVLQWSQFKSAEDFSNHAEEKIAQELGLEITNFTSTDKVEYAKLVLKA